MAESSQITQIVGEKLTKDNYSVWSYRMENFLMGKGMWDLITGDDECPELAENPTDDDKKAYKTWIEKSRKVLHWISICISESLIPHIKKAQTPKEAWDIIHKIYGTSTEAKKMQLKQRLHGIWRGSRTIHDYVAEIRNIAQDLASIDCPVEDDDLVSVTLNGLGPQYKSLDTSISVRGAMPDFDELVALCITEEVKLGLNASGSSSRGADQVLYHRGRGTQRGRNYQSNRGRYSGSSSPSYGGNFGRGETTYRGRGRSPARGRGSDAMSCHYCGRYGHWERDCYQKQNDTQRGRGRGRYQSHFHQRGRSQGYQQRDNRDNSGGHLFAMEQVLQSMTKPRSENCWYIDSGCTNHMTNHGEWFNEKNPMKKEEFVATGDNTLHSITHVGNVPLKLDTGEQNTLGDVLHVPTISKSLVSVGQMVDQNMEVKFNKYGCFIHDYSSNRTGKLLGQGKKVGRLFVLDAGKTITHDSLYSNQSKNFDVAELWHKRIGHVNYRKLKDMQRQETVRGLPQFGHLDFNHVCEACQFGKQSRLPFPRREVARRFPLELVHTDVWGPCDHTSLGQANYFLIFVDDFSRYTWIYFLQHKHQVFETFKEFKTMAEKQLGTYLKCLRSDAGGEFISNQFDAYLKEHGIRRQITCRYTPQQNGVAERKNRVIAEVARAMMNEKNMPLYYWAEACHTAVHIMNRTPTASVHNVSPYERLWGRKPTVSYFKVFGSLCYAHIPSEIRHKMDAKSVKCVFLGYPDERKGYKCYDPQTRKVYVSRDVTFDENNSWYTPNSDAVIPDSDEDYMPEKYVEHRQSSEHISGPSNEFEASTSSNPWNGKVKKNGKQKADEYDPMSDTSMDSETELPRIQTPGVLRRQGRYVPPHEREVHSEPSVRRSQRVRHPVDRLTYSGYMKMHYNYMVSLVQHVEPASFEEAVESEDWCHAMEEEMGALEKNKTWDLVPLPSGKKAIGCRWVYKVKCQANGEVERYKARLVAKGYAQTYGIDYDETFSPVAKMTTVRTVIALAAMKGWNLWQMDVKNAFLNGSLQEEVYMQQPQGFESSKHPEYVCKLKKALYGLKQAPRAWCDRFSQMLRSTGFVQSKADYSLYVMHGSEGIVIVVIYVDDLIVTGDNMNAMILLKKQLHKEFDMKDLGELRYFLGIEVIRSNDGIWLIQRQYALDMLKKFGMTACKPLDTPLDQNVKLSDDGDYLDDAYMYRRMVGGLIYLTITRPDLSYAVGIISQFMQKPCKSHLDVVRRLLRYVKTTCSYGLFYAHQDDSSVYGYSDADWAGNVDDRRSTSGYAFMLGRALVSWSSKKQPTVALSSTEAEYRGIALATCEAVWLKMLLSDLGFQIDGKIMIYCDNVSSMMLAKNPVYHARTKHIEIHYHYVREKVMDGEIDLAHVRTAEQVADIFTKALGKDKYGYLRKALGVHSIQAHSELEGENCE